MFWAIVASATTYSSNVYKDVKTYKVRVTHTYAATTCAPGWTGITNNKSNYSDSYKFARYIEYRDVSGKFVEYNKRYSQGTDSVIVTSFNPYENAVDGKVAKRSHYSNIKYTSEKTSTTKEILFYDIIKD